ncbi:hypothetical protein RIF23_20435 [Lipingzhangella sp. LS1_29]|uniref:Uncharacterized protein n=1 Tax=Lipingzhangella rawalii TaxID=2055835 RepID=A0ABU2HBK9_9ACTN|nr:hypothetical protein [Lipingzhangella rawalii]MDS1272658.1 hypothetical protein [Lipingzhangella rawalii]
MEHGPEPAYLTSLLGGAADLPDPAGAQLREAAHLAFGSSLETVVPPQRRSGPRGGDHGRVGAADTTSPEDAHEEQRHAAAVPRTPADSVVPEVSPAGHASTAGPPSAEPVGGPRPGVAQPAPNPRLSATARTVTRSRTHPEG